MKVLPALALAFANSFVVSAAIADIIDDPPFPGGTIVDWAPSAGAHGVSYGENFEAPQNSFLNDFTFGVESLDTVFPFTPVAAIAGVITNTSMMRVGLWDVSLASSFSRGGNNPTIVRKTCVMRGTLMPGMGDRPDWLPDGCRQSELRVTQHHYSAKLVCSGKTGGKMIGKIDAEFPSSERFVANVEITDARFPDTKKLGLMTIVLKKSWQKANCHE